MTPDAVDRLRRHADWLERHAPRHLMPGAPYLPDDIRSALAELDRLAHELDEAQVRSIVARNPGIDEDEVRASRRRTRNAATPDDPQVTPT